MSQKASRRLRGRPKLPGKPKFIRVREYVFQLWRERKRQLGFEKISDSNFAEILLHRCEDNVEVDESEIYVEDEGEFEYPAFPGDVIMPPSALDQLTRLHIVYPMLFKLSNARSGRNTHCGVLEFVADEGKIYLPYWMMRNLLLEEGGLLQVESASLPVASYAKFQPQSVDFLDITNPKAVLENALRSFACLTKGDIIAIKYNERIYELLVLETKPGNAVSIIECDMQVEFAPPVGYVEPEWQEKKEEKKEEEQTDEPHVDHGFQAFTGSGFRLDGKKKKSNVPSNPVPMGPPVIKRGIPNYDFEKGKITFKRNLNKSNNSQLNNKAEATKPEFEAFKGSGKTLRQKRKN